MANTEPSSILERLLDDEYVHEQLTAGGARLRDAYRRARRLPGHKAVQDQTLYDHIRAAVAALTEAGRRLAGKPKPEPKRRRRRPAVMLLGAGVTATAFYFARRADQAAQASRPVADAPPPGPAAPAPAGAANPPT